MSRIAFVLPYAVAFPVGGYRVVYGYASYLAAAGHDVLVYHAALDTTLRFRVRERLGRLVQRRAGWRVTDTRPSWFQLHPRVAVRNIPLLSAAYINDCDVLIATAAQTAPLVASVAHARHIRGAYLIQSFEDWGAPRAFVEQTWRLPLQRVVIAQWLQDKGRELGVQSTLVANAVDPIDMPAGPRIADRPISVLSLASSMAIKRTDLVATVMDRVLSEHPDARCVTFGTCPRPSFLPAAVEHYDDPPRARLRELFQASRVYLCASDADGWHLPAAEAMAAAAAVVSTDIGGVRAYAADTALFASIGDAPGLARAVLSLLDDPVACQDHASAGQHAILSYSPDDAGSAFARAILGGGTR